MAYANQLVKIVFNSKGFPGSVACMGNWFHKKNRGFIIGMWVGNTNLGDITGYIIGYTFITWYQIGWQYGILTVSLYLFTMSLITMIFL